MVEAPVHDVADLTWQEAEAFLRQRPIGLLPVGAIEAHGPHLPLNTDVVIATEMARRAARLLARDALPVLILPSLSYGVSFVGTCFPGTTPIHEDVFREHLTSLLGHLATQGYRALCLCNAHLEPAHVQAIRDATAVAQGKGVPIAFPDKRDERWAVRLSEEFRWGARHAGSYETSLMLAAQPTSVRHVHLEDLPPVWIDLPGRLREGARTFAEAGGTLGYFGDPAKATLEEGEQLFDALATMVREAVHEALALGSRPDGGEGR